MLMSPTSLSNEWIIILPNKINHLIDMYLARRKERTFERASELEDVFGNGDDFGADAIAGEESDAVPFGGWCGGSSGAPDSCRFKKVFGCGFNNKRGSK